MSLSGLQATTAFLQTLYFTYFSQLLAVKPLYRMFYYSSNIYYTPNPKKITARLSTFASFRAEFNCVILLNGGCALYNRKLASSIRKAKERRRSDDLFREQLVISVKYIFDIVRVRRGKVERWRTQAFLLLMEPPIARWWIQPFLGKFKELRHVRYYGIS